MNLKSKRTVDYICTFISLQKNTKSANLVVVGGGQHEAGGRLAAGVERHGVVPAANHLLDL